MPEQGPSSCSALSCQISSGLSGSGRLLPVKDKSASSISAEPLLPNRQAGLQFRGCAPYLCATASRCALPWATLETFDPLPSLRTPFGGCLHTLINSELSLLSSGPGLLLIRSVAHYRRCRRSLQPFRNRYLCYLPRTEPANRSSLASVDLSSDDVLTSIRQAGPRRKHEGPGFFLSFRTADLPHLPVTR